MSKLFHVTLQKWQAQTGDLLETLTKFLLYFLTTYDESNHQSLIVRIQSTSPVQNLLLFQHLHASLQAWPVEVAAAVEALHFLPQEAELRQARRHLRLRQTALTLNRARPSGVAGESGFPYGELRRLQPGFQAPEGPQHFHNLDSGGEVRQGTQRDIACLPEADTGFSSFVIKVLRIRFTKYSSIWVDLQPHSIQLLNYTAIRFLSLD